MRSKFLADVITLLNNDAPALDRSAIEICRYGVSFLLSKYTALPQDWQQIALPINHSGDPIEIASTFLYVGRLIIAGKIIEKKVKSRIAKANATFANLPHLRHRHGIRLSLSSLFSSLLLQDLSALRIAGEFLFSTIDISEGLLESGGDIGSGIEVSSCIGCKPLSLIEVVVLHRRWWHGHVLRVPAHRLPFRVRLRMLDKAGRSGVAVRLWLSAEVWKS